MGKGKSKNKKGKREKRKKGNGKREKGSEKREKGKGEKGKGRCVSNTKEVLIKFCPKGKKSDFTTKYKGNPN